MKKLMMTMVAALMLTATAMAQENNGRREGRNFDPAEMAKAQTERMVQEYGLNEAQKAKLLELNTQYAGKMRMGGRGGQRGGQRFGGPQGGNQQGGMQQGERPSREQMEARMKEMRENREAYNAELKNILTEEQFSKYEEAEKQRMERFGRGPRRQQ